MPCHLNVLVFDTKGKSCPCLTSVINIYRSHVHMQTLFISIMGLTWFHTKQKFHPYLIPGINIYRTRARIVPICVRFSPGDITPTLLILFLPHFAMKGHRVERLSHLANKIDVFMLTGHFPTFKMNLERKNVQQLKNHICVLHLM